MSTAAEYAQGKGGRVSGTCGDNPAGRVADTGRAEPTGGMAASPAPTPQPATIHDALREVRAWLADLTHFHDRCTTLGQHAAAAQWMARAEGMRVAERALASIAGLTVPAQLEVKALIKKHTPSR